MSRTRSRFQVVAFATVLATLSVGLPLAGAADKVKDGKSLVVPAEHAQLGKVYYVVNGKPGPNRDQIRFTNVPPKSKKEVDHFTGFSNAAIGYLVVPSEHSEGAVEFAAGEFIIPVASLDTGVKLRDKHIKQKKWLWNKKHKEISFSLQSVADISVEESSDASTTYAVTLKGTMTIRGTSKEMEIPARITTMQESDETRAIAPGDLIAIRAQYSVVLSDFGVKNGIIGKKVADSIQLEEFLVLSSERPE